MNGSSKASNEMVKIYIHSILSLSTTFKNRIQIKQGQEFLDEDEYDIDLEELKKMKLRKRISYWYLQVRHV